MHVVHGHELTNAATILTMLTILQCYNATMLQYSMLQCYNATILNTNNTTI